MMFVGAIWLGNLGEQHIRRTGESGDSTPVLRFLNHEKRAKNGMRQKPQAKDIVKRGKR
jgi:hypothetical protein